MPKIKDKNFNVIARMADGKEYTYQEFMSKPFLVRYAENKELFDEASVMLKAKLSAGERSSQEYTLTKNRKIKLQKELSTLKENI